MIRNGIGKGFINVFVPTLTKTWAIRSIYTTIHCVSSQYKVKEGDLTESLAITIPYKFFLDKKIRITYLLSNYRLASFRSIWLLSVRSPRQINIRTTKMTIGCCLTINRTTQIQSFNNTSRTQIKMFVN